MKNYYQQKKGGFDLEPVIYAKTVKQIRCYRFFQQVAARVDEKSPVNISEQDINNKIVAEQHIDAIEKGLENYVPEDYRDAVFAHVAEGIEYDELEEMYYLSVASMKRYVQVFVWGVAEELGESFKNVR